MKKKILLILLVVAVSVVAYFTVDSLRYRYIPIYSHPALYKIDRITGKVFWITPSGIIDIPQKDNKHETVIHEGWTGETNKK